jgi:hypothetical protein
MAVGGPTACGVWRELKVHRKFKKLPDAAGILWDVLCNGKWVWDFELGKNVRSLHKAVSLKL